VVGKAQNVCGTSSARKQLGADQQIPSGTAALPQRKSGCTGAIDTFKPSRTEKLGKRGRPCTDTRDRPHLAKAARAFNTRVKDVPYSKPLSGCSRCGCRSASPTLARALRWAIALSSTGCSILQCHALYGVRSRPWFRNGARHATRSRRERHISCRSWKHTLDSRSWPFVRGRTSTALVRRLSYMLHFHVPLRQPGRCLS